MCKECEALGEAALSHESHQVRGLAALDTDVVLKGTADCRKMLAGYSVLVNNCAEDVGSGLGIAVIVAVNPRFAALADSGEGVPEAAAVLLTSLCLKGAMAPLAEAMRAASRGDSDGDVHSPEN